MENLIKTKQSEQIIDPLEYAEIPFEVDEWSNIPSLVPQYCIHLSNHLKALIKYCKDKSHHDQLFTIITNQMDQQFQVIHKVLTHIE